MFSALKFFEASSIFIFYRYNTDSGYAYMSSIIMISSYWADEIGDIENHISSPNIALFV
jgi:hypothetical protein